MTGNQIAYASVLNDQKRTEIAEESNKIQEKANAEIKRHNEKTEELEASSQWIQQQIADNNKTLEEKRLEIQKWYNEQMTEIERTEVNVKTLEAETRAKLAEVEADWKYWNTYWSGVNASNETFRAQEDARHNKEREALEWANQSLESRRIQNEENKLLLANKQFEFDKTKWNEEYTLKGNIFEWNKQIDSSKINLDWANIGIQQRQNNLMQDRLLFDRERLEWQKTEFGRENVRKWFEVSTGNTIKIVDLFSPF